MLSTDWRRCRMYIWKRINQNCTSWIIYRRLWPQTIELSSIMVRHQNNSCSFGWKGIFLSLFWIWSYLSTSGNFKQSKISLTKVVDNLSPSSGGWYVILCFLYNTQNCATFLMSFLSALANSLHMGDMGTYAVIPTSQLLDILTNYKIPDDCI